MLFTAIVLVSLKRVSEASSQVLHAAPNEEKSGVLVTSEPGDVLVDIASAAGANPNEANSGGPKDTESSETNDAPESTQKCCSKKKWLIGGLLTVAGIGIAGAFLWPVLRQYFLGMPDTSNVTGSEIEVTAPKPVLGPHSRNYPVNFNGDILLCDEVEPEFLTADETDLCSTRNAGIQCQDDLQLVQGNDQHYPCKWLSKDDNGIEIEWTGQDTELPPGRLTGDKTTVQEENITGVPLDPNNTWETQTIRGFVGMQDLPVCIREDTIKNIEWDDGRTETRSDQQVAQIKSDILDAGQEFFDLIDKNLVEVDCADSPAIEIKMDDLTDKGSIYSTGKVCGDAATINNVKLIRLDQTLPEQGCGGMNGLHLDTVVKHEIGHTMGINHTPAGRIDIMSSDSGYRGRGGSDSPATNPKFSTDDVNRTQANWATITDCVHKTRREAYVATVGPLNKDGWTFSEDRQSLIPKGCAEFSDPDKCRGWVYSYDDNKDYGGNDPCAEGYVSQTA